MVDINKIYDNEAVEDKEIAKDIFFQSTKHPQQLSLLFIDLVLFLMLFFITYNKIKKLKKELKKDNDPKYKVANVLIAANGIRAVSLIIVIILENNSGNNKLSFVNYIAHVIPSLSFVSAYIILIYMLSKYYYDLEEKENHFLNPVLKISLFGCYLIITIVALYSLISNKYKTFMYISEFIIGFIYIIISSVLIYYGQLVGNYLSLRNEYQERSSRVNF